MNGAFPPRSHQRRELEEVTRERDDALKRAEIAETRLAAIESIADRIGQDIDRLQVVISPAQV